MSYLEIAGLWELPVHTFVSQLSVTLAYSVCIAQMFLIHCQPTVALEVNYHDKRALLF